MTKQNEIPTNHPRVKSLQIREKVIAHHKTRVVALAGLIAHGRGEAFDYLLGEKTTRHALKAVRAASAALLLAEKPVISVNGNVAALVANDIVRLAKITKAKIEVNLFYRSAEREKAVKKLLEEAGATQVYGVGEGASARIPELSSERRRVDPKGILAADAVLVPLEDGDRTEALVRMNKKVIAIDLNPLSRTAQFASITIVDNIVRAMPTLVETAEKLKKKGEKELTKIISGFDNRKNLTEAINAINKRLSNLAEKGKYISLLEMREK